MGFCRQREVPMNSRELNPLKTGVLFVAPGQIMDPEIMKLRRRPDYLSRLRADVGLDALEAEQVPVAQRSWSLRQLLEQLGDFVRLRRRAPARTVGA
jgi:hypothetical protein